MKGVRAVPILLVSALLLVVAGVRGQNLGLTDPMVASLMTAGLIAFGAWLHAEAKHDHHDLKMKSDEGAG
jgi:hypothetical protein